MKETNFFPFFNSDIILVIIGFYVGDEKRDLGRLPFNILLAIVAVIMILPEVSISNISHLKKLQRFSLSIWLIIT